MKTYNIPIFVPHRGCPFDCVFCNQNRITGETVCMTPENARDIIDNSLRTLPESGRYVEAAFFGGSFTGIPMNEQIALLSAAYEYKKQGLIDGIRISTRPDYINKSILDNLMKYGVTTIELGVQSMDDDVLRLANRGHTGDDVRKAVKLIREYPFILGLQMMTGLPGDNERRSVYTADEIIRLRPDIVRIYPTLTIRDTYLEEMYLRGEYKPQSLDEAVTAVKKLLLKFEAENINVIRVGLQSTEEISERGSVVAGPVHSAFRELVENSIYFDILSDMLRDRKCKKADVYVAAREVSKAVGIKKANIQKIKRDLDIDIKIHPDNKLEKREVRCICC